MIRGEIIDVGIAARSAGLDPVPPYLRFFLSFIGFAGWKRSMRKLYWLFGYHRITGAVFHVPPAEEMPRQAARWIQRGRGTESLS
jgi:hypothetical protein